MLVEGARRHYDEPCSSVVEIDHAAIVFAALGHRIRLELWNMLVPYGARGLSAGQIAAHIGIAPSSLSFHLQQMTQAGVLTRRRSRRQIIYAVNSGVVNGYVLSLRGTRPGKSFEYPLNHSDQPTIASAKARASAVVSTPEPLDRHLSHAPAKAWPKPLPWHAIETYWSPGP